VTKRVCPHCAASTAISNTTVLFTGRGIHTVSALLPEFGITDVSTRTLYYRQGLVTRCLAGQELDCASEIALLTDLAMWGGDPIRSRTRSR
jgi:hypothetical protein